MARYGKQRWDDGTDDMKPHRADHKFRGHRLSIGNGRIKSGRRPGNGFGKKSR